MESLKEQLKNLQQRLTNLPSFSSRQEQNKHIREIEAKTLKANFWEDQDTARQIMSELDSLQEEVDTIENLDQQIKDALSVIGQEELQSEIEDIIEKAKKEIERLETHAFLSAKYDKNNAVLSIHAGQGGTEAMDWAQMLLRMYLRYAEKQGWKTEVVDETDGEEAGIKSATFLIQGRYAYGLLKGEAGTHRLVRQSPFNADKLRQTSFALVEVLPQIEESQDLEPKESDLEWQFFHASSQGGQNVQKVSTAVRLIHKPTGIVVTSQSERYQEQNRKIALKLLRAKLWSREEAEREEKIKHIKGEYKPASWGTQIRSYVLHPYKLIKDLRTNYQTGNTEAVLNGEIDGFVESELRAKTNEK